MASTDFTIADVLAWARTKPADETYPYFDVCGCAMHQFLTERGLPVKEAGGYGGWEDINGVWHEPVDHIPLAQSPHTFGALAKRIEALISAEPISNTWTKADAYLSDIESVEA